MNLREYLEAKRISQNRAARELNATRQQINQIVNGDSQPGKELVKRMITWSGGMITARDSRPDWAEVMDKC